MQCGLAVESKKGISEIYDRFRGRIMFPIQDIVGKTIGFGGRIISETVKPAAGKQNISIPRKPGFIPKVRIYIESFRLKIRLWKRTKFL